MMRVNLCRIVLIGLLIAPTLALADQDEPETKLAEKIFDTFTFYWENDAFAGTDRDYSNGMKFTWSTPYDITGENDHLPDWSYSLFKHLPFVNDPDSHRAVSLSFGQMIFTPEDTVSSALVVDDRPYAGYLYVGSGFHSQRGNRKNSWEFQLGVVGPLSFAKETQNVVHDALNNLKAEGWDNQLDNEVAVEIICESKWRFFHTETKNSFSYDLIPHLGARLGNVQIYANTGAEIRYGWNLPGNFGSCPIRAGCATNSAFGRGPVNSGRFIDSWHIFMAVDGRAVARDIFLDGNTFKDSHSVDREILVGDVMAGLTANFGRVRTTYSYVLRTKQFAGDRGHQLFGSLTLSLTY